MSKPFDRAQPSGRRERVTKIVLLRRYIFLGETATRILGLYEPVTCAGGVLGADKDRAKSTAIRGRCAACKGGCPGMWCKSKFLRAAGASAGKRVVLAQFSVRDVAEGLSV